MGHAGGNSEVLIATSMSVCAISLCDGIRWQGVGPGGSLLKPSIEVVSYALSACR